MLPHKVRKQNNHSMRESEKEIARAAVLATEKLMREKLS